MNALYHFLRKSALFTDPDSLKTEMRKDPLLADLFTTFETSRPQRTLATLYHLAYSQSSHANAFQKELASALDRFGVSDRALEMLHAIGATVSIDTLRRFQHERMENHPAWVDRALRDNAGVMMNLYIDDYTAIHGIVCVTLLFFPFQYKLCNGLPDINHNEHFLCS